MVKYVLLVLLVWNLITFLIYGIDKRKAIKDRQRISERTLIILSFAFGSAGALAGMLIFRHKTRKAKFIFLVPFSLLLDLSAIIATWYFLFR